MTDPALKDLARLTEALFQVELAKLQDLAQRESKLRQDLAQLEDQRRTNMSLPLAQMEGVRQIGADVLWQGWVGRTRADLQTQLALVLARKGQMMKTLRRAFGKQQAAAELLETSRQKQGHLETDLRQKQEDNLMLISTYADRQHRD